MLVAGGDQRLVFPWNLMNTNPYLHSLAQIHNIRILIDQQQQQQQQLQHREEQQQKQQQQQLQQLQPLQYLIPPPVRGKTSSLCSAKTRVLYYFNTDWLFDCAFK